MIFDTWFASQNERGLTQMKSRRSIIVWWNSRCEGIGWAQHGPCHRQNNVLFPHSQTCPHLIPWILLDMLRCVAGGKIKTSSEVKFTSQLDFKIWDFSWIIQIYAVWSQGFFKVEEGDRTEVRVREKERDKNAVLQALKLEEGARSQGM